MRISDWSSDVCSSDLPGGVDGEGEHALDVVHQRAGRQRTGIACDRGQAFGQRAPWPADQCRRRGQPVDQVVQRGFEQRCLAARSAEHTSELQSLMRISYAVFCLKKKQYQELNEKSHCATKNK